MKAAVCSEGRTRGRLLEEGSVGGVFAVLHCAGVKDESACPVAVVVRRLPSCCGHGLWTGSVGDVRRRSLRRWNSDSAPLLAAMSTLFVLRLLKPLLRMLWIWRLRIAGEVAYVSGRRRGSY